MNVIEKLFGSQGSALLDIETLGTRPGSPIHQVSLIADSKGFEYYPKPQEITNKSGLVVDLWRLKENERKIKDIPSWERALEKYKSHFTDKRIASGDWSWLTEQLKSKDKVKFSGLELDVERKFGNRLSSDIVDVLEKSKDKILWIANVPFEAKHLGSVLEAELTPHEAAKVKSLFTYGNTNIRDILYVNDPGIMKARSIANRTGDWSGVWTAIKNIDTSKKGIKVLDVMDLLKASQSNAQKVSNLLGLGFNFKEVRRGTALSIQARIMGLSPELHKATEDNLLSSLIGKKAAQHNLAFEGLLERAQRGTQNLQLTAEEADALNWAHKFQETKNSTKELYARKHVASMLMDETEAQIKGVQFRHRVSDGYSTGYINSTHEGKLQKIQFEKSNYRYVKTPEAALERIGKLEGNEGIDLLGIRKQMIQGASGLTDSQQKYEYFKNISENISERTEEQVVHNLGKINNKFKAGEILSGGLGSIPNLNTRATIPIAKTTKGINNRTIFKNSIKYGGIVGLGIFGLAAIKSLSDSFNRVEGDSAAYQTVNGLGEDNYASYLREQNTDFGSPYQGLFNSTSLELANRLTSGDSTPVYMNNMQIDQRIADFKDFNMQTPLQKRLIESEVTKQSLKSFSSTYYLDPTLTTPLASEDYQKYGVAKKGLQVIDLSKVNWAVEDADTIVLTQGIRGLVGQSMSIRLSGIDAPEVKHSDEEMKSLRLDQGQPYGEEAKLGLESIMANSTGLKLIVDPSKDTYGRSLGVLVNDKENINLEMVKRGYVGALPFGDSKDDLIKRNIIGAAEQNAYNGMKGMWKDDFWRTYRRTVNNKYRVTNNTLTRLDKMAGNMNLAALFTTMNNAGEEGYDEAVNQSINNLRPKFAKMGQDNKKEYKPYRLDYYHSQNDYLDQIKVETNHFIKNYGNQTVSKMGIRNHNTINTSVNIDSLSKSMSVYHERSPQILDKYENKMARKKMQGVLQRQANQTMNSNSQNSYKM